MFLNIFFFFCFSRSRVKNNSSHVSLNNCISLNSMEQKKRKILLIDAIRSLFIRSIIRSETRDSKTMRLKVTVKKAITVVAGAFRSSTRVTCVPLNGQETHLDFFFHYRRMLDIT